MMSIARDSVVSCVRRFGGLASSALLDQAYQIFMVPNIHGLIGYRVVWRSAVVFGDPVTSLEDRDVLVDAFHDYCEKEGFTIVYLTASEEFAKWALKKRGGSYIEFGSEVYLDPQSDPLKGAKGSLARRKVRQAIKEGVTVKEYEGFEPDLEKAIEKIGDAWLNGRKGLQIYISNLNFFENREGKRWLYAEREGKVVGALDFNRLKAHDGWLVSHIIVDPESPKSVSELLVISVVEKLREEGCHYVSFGAVQGDTLGEVEGLGKLSTFFACLGFKIARRVFRLQGRKKYWEKFQAQTRRSYLVFSRAKVGVREIVALIRTLNISK